MRDIGAIFNLFRLDRAIQSRQDLALEEIIELIGGYPDTQFTPTWRRVEEEYKGWGYAERFWRVRGTDFIVDVFDRGNGWYMIMKVKEAI